MSHQILIPICIVGGWILKRGKIFPKNTGFALGNFVVSISLTALILASVPTMKLETSLIYLDSMPCILFGLSVVFFYLIGKF
ncbi:malate permease, partial [Leptospira borgpetersenii serovar Hardjo-bovis]|nr:malate permease [Leptospira borgpetersenii serovar Hardjo-bovis]